MINASCASSLRVPDWRHSVVISLTYDFDSNLSNDGMFQYDYDAENRLISVTPLDPASGLKKTTFAYDYQHRRSLKQVYEWQTDDWSLSAEHWYVYNGWNVIRETTTTNLGNTVKMAHLTSLSLIMPPLRGL